jgi:hypothetical protein
MRELGAMKKKDFCLRFRGRRASILVEEKIDRATGLRGGFSRNYLPVLVSGAGNLVNREIEVEIESFEDGRLKGTQLAMASAPVERHDAFVSNPS